jgi:hypothetical protein
MRYSHPRLKRMCSREREINRILTKLETSPVKRIRMVLPGWIADLLQKMGYRVGRDNHCKAGVYWYNVSWRY